MKYIAEMLTGKNGTAALRVGRMRRPRILKKVAADAAWRDNPLRREPRPNGRMRAEAPRCFDVARTQEKT